MNLLVDPSTVHINQDSPTNVHLKKEVQELKSDLRRLRRRPSRSALYPLLAAGGISLIASAVITNVVLSFIGLGLTFWGALLMYVTPTNYVRHDIMDSTSLSSLKILDNMIGELGYMGKAVYIPPRSPEEYRVSRIFIPKHGNLPALMSEADLPAVEDFETERTVLEDPEGLSLAAPGEQLMRLYQRELGVDFYHIDLDYLQKHLPGLLTNDLELLEEMEFTVKRDFARVKITGKGAEFCDNVESSSNLGVSLGCPLHSSLALVLSRATRKAVTIEKSSFNLENKTVESTYQFHQISPVKSYCLKCRREREMVDLKHVTWRNGKKALSGKCRQCNSTISRIRRG